MAWLYKIAEWDERFENFRSRAMGSVRWFMLPNKYDGEAYNFLMAQPNGMALYGAWVLIVGVASRCKKRGILTQIDGSPHTPETIAKMTRSDSVYIAQALDILVNIKWMTRAQWTRNVNGNNELPEIHERCNGIYAKDTEVSLQEIHEYSENGYENSEEGKKERRKEGKKEPAAQPPEGTKQKIETASEARAVNPVLPTCEKTAAAVQPVSENGNEKQPLRTDASQENWTILATVMRRGWDEEPVRRVLAHWMPKYPELSESLVNELLGKYIQCNAKPGINDRAAWVINALGLAPQHHVQSAAKAVREVRESMQDKAADPRCVALIKEMLSALNKPTGMTVGAIQ